MVASELFVLHTKLTPPRRHRRLLPRPALTARLAEALDYRLTIVQANTGYGKSTALAELSERAPLFWLSVDESDRDPQRLLLHLTTSFQRGLPGFSDAPLALLQEGGYPWPAIAAAVINALGEALTAPSLLVLDDFHCIAGDPEIASLADYIIQHMPANLHLVVVTHHSFESAGLADWRVRGEVLQIDSHDLAFSAAEVAALFAEHYDMQLSEADVQAMISKTEGWPIALQMVWQGLRSGHASTVPDLLAGQGTGTLGGLPGLFDYLARNVFHRLPGEMADFLRQTAVLRVLSPGACNAVTNAPHGAAMLTRLQDLDLFLVHLGGEHYRYQHLFHDFLLGQLAANPAQVQIGHQRAGAYFREQGEFTEAIYHWLAASSYADAAQDIIRAGEQALAQGRRSTLAGWIDALPPEILAEHPMLQYFQGDLYRLASRFDEALAWYSAAEATWQARGDRRGVGIALRGQARVYLDTVRPAKAEQLLQQALALSDGLADRQARARLFELIAENKLNMGKPAEAEGLLAEAQALRDRGTDEDVLGVRVKLRTGRLDEAQQQLERWLASERDAVARGDQHAPRAHRETVLILSLIDSFKGNTRRAQLLAEEGIALGETLGSPFVTAVGQMRLGHALQLLTATGESDSPQHAAAACYQKAIKLGDDMAVRRIRAEAMWGLARVYGFFGDVVAAERAACEGIEIGQWAGDPWICGLAELALGASYVLAGQRTPGNESLLRALQTFRDCADPLGQTAARLWLSVAYFEGGQAGWLRPNVEELLQLAEAHGYDFLLTRATLLGLPDPRRSVPLWIWARNEGVQRAYATRLLAALGLDEAEIHAGYQLRVQTLGAFRVWRGMHEVTKSDWRRDKARQLFQLFLTFRGRMLDREQIVEMLWPDLDAATAQRDFKVALNSLYKVLEPRRTSGAASAFFERRGTAYGLRADADLWLDADEFEAEIQAVEAGLLRTPGQTASALGRLQAALALYRGAYLEEHPYEEWALNERERLHLRYMRAADRTVELLLADGQATAAMDLCEQMLRHDNCWERAYYHLMAAHGALGNRAQALRTYQRCASTLQRELGAAPSPYIQRYHDALVVESRRVG